MNKSVTQAVDDLNEVLHEMMCFKHERDNEKEAIELAKKCHKCEIQLVVSYAEVTKGTLEGLGPIQVTQPLIVFIRKLNNLGVV